MIETVTEIYVTHQPVLHKCPVCDGTGTVNNSLLGVRHGFYSSAIAVHPCVNCNGTGIVSLVSAIS